MRARLIVATIVGAGAVLAIGGTMALAGKPKRRRSVCYPDFASAVPHHFTVQNTWQDEILRFSNGIANIGAGPFQIRPENNPTTLKTTASRRCSTRPARSSSDQAVSEFVFHPAAQPLAHHRGRPVRGARCPRRRHGRQLGRHRRRAVAEDDVLPDRLDQARGNSNNNGRTYTDCKPTLARGSRSAGSTSTTRPSKARRSRSRASLPGIYYLVTTANPDGNFLETTTTNNTAWTSFRLTRDNTWQREDHGDLAQPLLGRAVRRADTEPLTVGCGRADLRPAADPLL